MQVALDPISASPEVEADIEREIATWFKDVVFQPLFDLFDVDRNNSAEDWTAFPIALGSLGLSREQMPQIEADDRPALIKHLSTLGIGSREIEVRPDELKPTQEYYSPIRVERAREHGGKDRAILVSRELRILDGHHQWYAALQDRPRQKITVVVFDASIPDLLEAVDDFPCVVRDNAVFHPELDRALFSGRVSYANGTFSGTFSSTISRELRALGARFEPRGGTFKLALERTPYSLRGAIAISKEQSKRLHDSLLSNLATIGQNVAVGKTLGLDVEPLVVKMMRDLNKQFVESVHRATSVESSLETVTVPPDFSEGMVRDVRENLTESLELPIKSFTEEQTLLLRRLVEENWNLGGRVDRVQEIIRNRFGVSERKAAFLARQETTMVASEFARARAQEIGSSDYVWVTRRDANVRLDHQKLNGTKQQWDSPPVADIARDVHANPGMVWGCRCLARPLLNIAARRVV